MTRPKKSPGAGRRDFLKRGALAGAAALASPGATLAEPSPSLAHFAESAVRAYKVALTPPMAPVVLVADGMLQEDPIPDRARLSIPKLTMPTLPQADSAAVAEVARLLVGAESPVLIADRLARTPAAMPLLVDLAETLQAAVIDRGGRMNFPSRHPTKRRAARRVRAWVPTRFHSPGSWRTFARRAARCRLTRRK